MQNCQKGQLIERVKQNLENETWKQARNELRRAVSETGYPEEFADLLARNLGSPRAIRRMTAYIQNVRPGSVEQIADEMLAICSDVETWKRKHEGLQANIQINRLLNEGLDTE